MHNGYISDRQGTIIDRELLNKPTKRGNAPTFKEDGTSVELHHRDQNPEGPFDEMHWLDHRGKGNYTINHQKIGKPSLIDREKFKIQKREYWEEVFDNWED
ncbi:HNH/ENDO VII family nuclease [Capnocytophaga canimorsus]|uniref:HNH/ENDO VII family nuclease n=1 Tax=Capnocytophaga canimorsus TaxID=28188 RepID=UPI0037CF6CC3